jgi:hypothetical protein
VGSSEKRIFASEKRKIMNNHALHIILLSNIILLANAGGSEYCA